MKQIILGAIALIGVVSGAKAQCDKSVQLTSAKTNFLNASYQVQGSKDENVTVEITKTTVTVTPDGNPQNALTGTIKENTCNWTVPFKEGKTVIKTILVDPSGDEKDATLTIEGKAGKITLLAEAKEHPDQKLQLEVAKFEEKTQ